MSTPFRQFNPVELYIGIDNPKPIVPEGDDSQPTEKINGFRSTGIEFLDLYLNNLYVHGLVTCTYHAKLLGIEQIALNYTVQTLTGMRYIEFSTQCIVLMANDLLNKKDADIHKIPNRLGFVTYSGFYRFMKRHTNRTPTGVTRYRSNYKLFGEMMEREKNL